MHVWGCRSIGDLVNLQAADFSNNPEFGADGCCEGKDAHYKSVYGYNFTIPTEMGRLKRLQVLKMDHSRFMRVIPTEIGEMRSLKFWRVQGSTEDLTGNMISGTIPSQFGQLKYLEEFFMDNNNISGTIPPELGTGRLLKLETFSVSGNYLSGTIPSELFNAMPSLVHWDTFNNKMTGELPESIQNATNLQYLYIQNEHTGAARNYHCQQRIDQAARGRKTNWQVLANEYIKYSKMSVCVNPYDVAGATSPPAPSARPCPCRHTSGSRRTRASHSAMRARCRRVRQTARRLMSHAHRMLSAPPRACWVAASSRAAGFAFVFRLRVPRSRIGCWCCWRVVGQCC